MMAKKRRSISAKKKKANGAEKTNMNSFASYTSSRTSLQPQKLKRYLTLDQEFEIMKLVLDKFLWLGFLIMAFGLYICIMQNIRDGLYFILAGVIILLLFVWMIIKEYEVIAR